MVTMLLSAPLAALAAGVTNIFTPGTLISSAAMNQNFQEVTDRITGLEESTALNDYSESTVPDAGLISCGPADGTYVMVGKYSDSGDDEYSEGYYTENGGRVVDYPGTPPRKVVFNNVAISGTSGTWNAATFALQSAKFPNLIAPIDGLNRTGSITVLSATIVKDDYKTGRTVGGSRSFRCQHTQIIDLQIQLGTQVLHQQDAVVLTSNANGDSWKVTEFFTNMEGTTVLTSYQWQPVPSQPVRAANGM